MDTTTPGSGDSRTIWVFTPSRTDPKDLESILVQRHALLTDAVERVRESALSSHKHHLLFVGPRGCGKTHLVTLIVSRLGADATLASRLRIAWLNEDETCTSLLELLLKVHAALEKRYPAEYRPAALEPAYELKQKDAQEFVAQLLLTSLGDDRTLLIVAENLDAIFDGLKESGQKELRAFIQENPRLTLVATAQRLVDDLAERTSPFFGFFQTEHLRPLNVTEATQLLQNIAKVQGKTGVVEFLATSRGRSRVRALHHLSGGNHRIYIVLSQFITQDNVEALIVPFMKMVDELTPYYQERIRWLPPLQRKIIEYLCVCETTVPVKDIAKRLFSTHPTISSQLQDLREKGYVTANQRGRESLYEVSEPLMRICIEVKENQTHQPLRLLVDFLRVWYDDEELKTRREQLDPTSVSCAYLESALQRNSTEGNLRKRIFLESIRMAHAEEQKNWIKLPEEVILAIKNFEDDNIPEAIFQLNEVLSRNISPPQRSHWLTLRGAFLQKIGETQRAFNDFTTAIELDGAPHHALGMAFEKRGYINLLHIGDSEQAKKDFTKAIELEGTHKSIIHPALVGMGLAYLSENNIEEALSALNKAVAFRGASPSEITSAIAGRSIAHRLAGDIKHEIADHTALINLAGISNENLAAAFCARGAAYLRENKLSEAKADLDSFLNLAAAPTGNTVILCIGISSHYLREGQWSMGFQFLEKGLEYSTKLQANLYSEASDPIGKLFEAGLPPQGRHEQLSHLLALYKKYDLLPSLGEAVVKHLGEILRANAPLPTADNLDSWLTAWEQAAEGTPEFSLTLRLLRVGIAFLKTGGKDPSVLLDLTTPEREILKQTFGLDQPEATAGSEPA